MNIVLLKNDESNDFEIQNQLKKEFKNHFNSNDEKRKMQNLINEKINFILNNDDIDQLEDEFNFFIKYLKTNDYILPVEFLDKLKYFLINSNGKDIKTLLKLIRFTTSFKSDMQKFYINPNYINILSSFLPNDEIFDTFANLAVENQDAKDLFLGFHILEYLEKFIDDYEHFPSAVYFSNAILYNINEITNEEYISGFIRLYQMIWNKLFNSSERCDDDFYTIGVKAFRDYIEADERFMNNFLQLNQIIPFINLSNMNSNFDYNRALLRICEIMIYYKKELASTYLLKNNIIEWLHQFFASEFQELRRLSFLNMYCLIDCIPPLSDELVKLDIHTCAIFEFNSDNTSYQYKLVLFKFLCILFNNASQNYILELIDSNLFDLLINNITLLDDERTLWVPMLECILKLRYFMENSQVRELVKRIKSNSDFCYWLHDAEECDKYNIADLGYLSLGFLKSTFDDYDYSM